MTHYTEIQLRDFFKEFEYNQIQRITNYINKMVDELAVLEKEYQIKYEKINFDKNVDINFKFTANKSRIKFNLDKVGMAGEDRQLLEDRFMKIYDRYFPPGKKLKWI